MIAQPPPLTSPSPVADPLAGLLVALDLRGVQLLLDADGQPRAKLPPGAVLDAETRELLGANRVAIVEHLRGAPETTRRIALIAAYEDVLPSIGRDVQALYASRGRQHPESLAMEAGFCRALSRLEGLYLEVDG